MNVAEAMVRGRSMWIWIFRGPHRGTCEALPCDCGRERVLDDWLRSDASTVAERGMDMFRWISDAPDRPHCLTLAQGIYGGESIAGPCDCGRQKALDEWQES